MAEQSNGIKMLRIEQVAEKVGYKESTIYDWMNPTSPRHKSHFPLPRKNGRSNRWFESEIDDFCVLEFGDIRNRPANNRSQISNTPTAPSAGASQVAAPGEAKIAKVVPSAPKIVTPRKPEVNDSIVPMGGAKPGVSDSMSDQQVGVPTAQSSPRTPPPTGKVKITLTKIDGADKTGVHRIAIPKRRTFLKSD